jgi:hypothetical protein
VEPGIGTGDRPASADTPLLARIVSVRSGDAAGGGVPATFGPAARAGCDLRPFPWRPRRSQGGRRESGCRRST